MSLGSSNGYWKYQNVGQLAEKARHLVNSQTYDIQINIQRILN